MKKITGSLIASVLLLALVGCGTSKTPPIGRVYSFSGEGEKIRVLNGVAVVGGESDTFYGGTLELKTDDFKPISGYRLEFYLSDDTENRTILSNAVTDETGTIQLKNQEIGQITGPILNKNVEESRLKEHLYFDLIITDENGDTERYTVPMEVTEVTTTT